MTGRQVLLKYTITMVKHLVNYMNLKESYANTYLPVAVWSEHWFPSEEW